MSLDWLRFLINRARERLWVRPLVACLLSIAGAFAAKLADHTGIQELVPTINAASIETLLSIMASSMLVIATFAVASMVAAYASASGAATPRSFTLVIADDVSQNALSTFIGAFIFSIVALIAVKNSYFAAAGLFTVFALTVGVFGLVIFIFVRWVDRIARLGRLGMTIDKVESATAAALRRRREAPTLHGTQVSSRQPPEKVVTAAKAGYVQQVDLAALQARAEKVDGRVVVAALPGSFAGPGRPLAYVDAAPDEAGRVELEEVASAFRIGDDRKFDDDPRFGLVVLSQIAARALSPAVNDPGTAIDIIGTLVRLFALWCEPTAAASDETPKFDRVEVPELSARDLLDDAFTAIARDGAGAVEVAVRLQKALHSLTLLDNAAIRDAAVDHSRLALARAARAMDLPEDLEAVRAAAGPEVEAAS